jgi:para-aminobenzoate synthetase component 1
VSERNKQYHIDDIRLFQNKMLSWSSRFNIFCLAGSFGYQNAYSRYELLFAAQPTAIYEQIESWSPSALKQFAEQHPGWLFGHLNYPGEAPDPVGFPACFFFEPGLCITLTDHLLTIRSTVEHPDAIMLAIQACEPLSENMPPFDGQIQPIQLRDDYLNAVHTVKQHIARGDCYELNYCQGFQAISHAVNPFLFFQKLTEQSPNPFSVLYRLDERFCLSASPERFLQRVGNTVISQPIKGTIRRDHGQAALDESLRHELYHSEKDRSENVMVVDLVRNDLSKVCIRNSVQVAELFGVHTFPNMHHLISTIEGDVEEDTHWTTILDACFPMGSMTGAPKIKVMELTEKLEASPRGLFSGTIGYVEPDGHFDFNVVIRSLFYNRETGLIHVKAGGGITSASEPEAEYEESLLKASAILTLLRSGQ